MSVVPSFLIDVRGRLWERPHNVRELTLSEIPYLFKSSCPIVRNFAITEDDYLFNLHDKKIINPIGSPESITKVKRVGVASRDKLAVITEDNRGIICDYDNVVIIIINDVHQVVGEVGQREDGVVKKARKTQYPDDTIVEELDLRVNIDDIIDCLCGVIVMRDRIYTFNDRCEFFKIDYHSGIITAIGFDTHEGCHQNDFLTLIEGNGIVSQPFRDGSIRTNLLSDELDDGTPWKEFFKIQRNYIGIVNRSGKAYCVHNTMSISRLDLPRESLPTPSARSSSDLVLLRTQPTKVNYYIQRM